MNKQVQKFADKEGLELVTDDRFSYSILVDEGRDYFELDSGLVVCCDGDDVFVMHTFEAERDVLDNQTLSEQILPSRIENLAQRIDQQNWSYISELPSDASDGDLSGTDFPDPYEEAVVATFSTTDGVKKSLEEATKLVRSTDTTTKLVETMYDSFVGYPMMEYESAPYNAVSSKRKRIGRINEWSFKFVRISVVDIDDTQDTSDRQEQMVGRLLADPEEIPYTETQVDSTVEIAPPSQSDITAENEESTYRVGIVFDAL